MPDALTPPVGSKTREQLREEWIALSYMTVEQFDALQASYQAWAKGMPLTGEDAPDFAVDIMNKNQARTRKSRTLSDFRGRLVGLIFGSYT